MILSNHIVINIDTVDSLPVLIYYIKINVILNNLKCWSSLEVFFLCQQKSYLEASIEKKNRFDVLYIYDKCGLSNIRCDHESFYYSITK